MAITQFDTENDDRDLTSQVTCLTDTPDASNATLCIGYIAFGDGTKNLDGTGGLFELTVTVGGQTVEPDPQIIYFSTAVRVAVWTSPFLVPANAAVLLKAKSPNVADTDVDVTAYLYEVGGATEIAAVKAETVLIVEDTGTTLPALITAASPQAHDCDSVTDTTGTVTGGDVHTDTHTDDGSYYQVAPETPADGDGFGLSQTFIYTIGVGRVPEAISVNGYFDAAAPNNDNRAVEVWAYNYTTTAWEQISDAGSHMDDESGDQDYQYVLGEGNFKIADGEVSIRFTSTSTTVGDALYLDHLTLSSVAQAAAGLTAEAIANAVMHHDVGDHPDPGVAGGILSMSIVFSGMVTTADSTSSFSVSTLPGTADLYNQYTIVVHDISTDVMEKKVVEDMDNAGVLTLDSALSFTPAIGDHVAIRSLSSKAVTDAILVDTNEIQGKLPDDYIMGSSVTDPMDDEINAIKANLGQVHTVEDESPGGTAGAAGTSGIAEGC